MSEIISKIPTGSLIFFSMLTLISIIFCILQIFKKEKKYLPSFSKISIVFPLLYVLVYILRGISMAFNDIKKANDMSTEILVGGLFEGFIYILIGLTITIFLFILYSITSTIRDNLGS